MYIIRADEIKKKSKPSFFVYSFSELFSVSYFSIVLFTFCCSFHVYIHSFFLFAAHSSVFPAKKKTEREKKIYSFRLHSNKKSWKNVHAESFPSSSSSVNYSRIHPCEMGQFGMTNKYFSGYMRQQFSIDNHEKCALVHLRAEEVTQ